MWQKQHAIIDYLRSHDSITLTKAVEIVGGNIYCNRKQYVGRTLSRMVNKNYIVRIKPGLFKLPDLGNVTLQSNDLFGDN